jgi:hypothetical protein
LLIGQFEKAVEVLHNITAECEEKAAVRAEETLLSAMWAKGSPWLTASESRTFSAQ